MREQGRSLTVGRLPPLCQSPKLRSKGKLGFGIGRAIVYSAWVAIAAEVADCIIHELSSDLEPEDGGIEGGVNNRRV